MTEECRPDPDSLLRRLQHEEQEASRVRGRLKIFLGAAAGVGKTYQMLEEAQSLKKNCVDVEVAVVETHGRPETEALLKELEVIPRRHINRGGVVLEEMDLDAVLSRHPAIALVDELAHTNAPGSRHDKRYQDVEELLEAGVSVYTTLNIQHIESLKDVVYLITGVRVSESIPDRILELADEIEVVDLPPEELLLRLKEGKVYVAPQAKQAMSRFFRKGNLLGLRELALRYAARKVDVDMRSYMEQKGILGPWPAGSRILVCISTSPLSERLLRIGQRMAADQDAEWFAVHVESSQEAPPTEAEKDQLARNMKLAEELGAKVQVLNGYRISEEIYSFAGENNITIIIVGLPRRSLWNRLFRGSVVNEIVNHSGPIHVLVIGSSETEQKVEKKKTAPNVPEGRSNWQAFYGSLTSIVVMTAFLWMLHPWLGLINTEMLLLLPVVYSSMTWGRRSGLMASLMAVLALDFFFIPPQLGMTFADVRYVPLFLVFIIVGNVTSILTDQVRWQRESARQRERFVSALYSFSRDLMSADNLEAILRYATKEIAEAFECEVMILLPDENRKLQVRAQMGEHLVFDERRLGVATWVFEHGQPAGRGTETLSSATLFYLPLKAKEVTVGVLGVSLGMPDRLLLPEQRRLLESFASIIAMALARNLPAPEPTDIDKRYTFKYNEI
jgi:two-component system, OmpR family, sensor histidine kinase KdpD